MHKTNSLIMDNIIPPNHSGELSRVNNNIISIKKKIDQYYLDVKLIDDTEFVDLYEYIIRVLDYVGSLSLSASEISNRIEEEYKFKHLKSPELGRFLWIKHCDELHKPYNNLKNRCFGLLDELDEYYIELYGKNPPNWNP